MYIKVPKEFSSEYKVVEYPTYDNETRKMKGTIKKEVEDIRWKPIKDMADVIQWIDRVKEHIMTKAYAAGIRLPSTKTGIEQTTQTLEDYKKSISI